MCSGIGKLAIGFVLLLFATCSASADSILTSRGALNTLLGSNAVNENFEGLSVPNGTTTNVGVTLDSTTVVNGHGPGLVVPGFQLQDTAAGSVILWQGNNDFSLPTETIGTSTSGHWPSISPCP